MIEIPESFLLTVVSGLVSAGGTWSVVKYRALEAHRSAAAAHKRIDEYTEKAGEKLVARDKVVDAALLRLEMQQEFLEKTVAQDLKHVTAALGEVKTAIDKLQTNGVHCGHCPGPEA